MPTNALAIYGKIDNPIAFATEMAMAAAKMIGCDPDQGKAMALQALADGVNLMDLRKRYHWIQGAPSFRADAMRAEFRMNHGGQYKVVENSPDRAAIEFVDRDGAVLLSEVTWAQAALEPWPWKRDCGPGTKNNDPNNPALLKDNWATPLSRANMLIARATSRGLRLLCPELVAGIYTPEEMGDVIDVNPTSVTVEPAKPTASQIVAAHAENAASDAVAMADGDEKVQDAEFTPKDPTASGAESSTTAAPSSAPVDPKAPGSISRGQLDELNTLFSRIWTEDKATEARANAMKKRGVQSFHNLSKVQGDELLTVLRNKDRDRAAASSGN